jgi:hypothetical protein
MKPQRTLVITPSLDNLAFWLQNHATVLSGRVSFGSSMSNADPDRNIHCFKATGTTPATANTEFAITHNFGQIPNTLVGWDTNNGGVLYRSTTPWTKTQVFLKCTTASAAFNVILA